MSEYMGTMRLINKLVRDPALAYDDVFIMALLLLGMWEHGNSLALEPWNKGVHERGIIAIIKGRPRESFASDLSRKLLMSVHASIIYFCIEKGDFEPLENLADYADNLRIDEIDHSEFNDFCLLGQHVVDIPKLQLREKQLFGKLARGQLCLSEAASLLQDLLLEDAKLVTWPSLRDHRAPYKSLPLNHGIESPKYDLFPRRIDCYLNGTVANMVNAWRLARIHLLTRISRITHLLAQYANPTLSQNHIKTKTDADTTVREYIDDLCCSIPFFMSPNNPEAMLAQYPHAAGEARIPCDPGPDLIASMSQMRHTNAVASNAPGVPRAQRQWLQQYLTVLSRDPVGDRAKAMRLELR